MKKPEVLITELSKKISLYLTSTVEDGIAMTPGLYKDISTFLKTNILFWGDLNVNNFHCDALLLEHTLIYLAQFVEDDTGNIYNVPVRKLMCFDAEQYCLPKIFKIGKYILGDLIVTVDKSGHFTYERPSKEKVFYTDLVKDTEANTKQNFNKIIERLDNLNCPLLIPLDKKRHHYRVMGHAVVKQLDDKTIITQVNPALGTGGLANVLSYESIGLVQVDQRDPCIAVIGAACGFVAPLDSMLLKSGIAYNGSDYFIVESNKIMNELATLYPITHSEIDNKFDDSYKFYYMRNNFIKEAK